jgi:membrane protein YdbS with pleckstrin-like domain
VLRRSYKRRLISGEVLVKCVHQHWRVITLPIIYTVLVAAPLITLLVTVFDGSWGGLLFGLVALVGLIVWSRFALPSLVRWYAASYAVTSRRVLFREGVLHRHYEQVELLGVNNPELDRSGWDLVFGTGTINLGSGRVMRRVPRVVRIEQLISQLAANQTKDVIEMTRLLRNMGYSKLTTK